MTIHLSYQILSQHFQSAADKGKLFTHTYAEKLQHFLCNLCRQTFLTPAPLSVNFPHICVQNVTQIMSAGGWSEENAKQKQSPRAEHI